MQKTAVSTQIVQPIIPALAPRAISEACSEVPKYPAIITAAAITAGKAIKIPAKETAGKAIKIPAKDFEGITCSRIKQAATAVPPKTNLRARSLKFNFIIKLPYYLLFLFINFHFLI